ncbi:arsenic resistance protein [Lacicoccus qingdaonensis]|uniref:Arsenite efflux pump ArsB, ACR3 family n=1 Tax=Lacicoccus qingdaonensis TaxID=576118 RepID=A0A1G9BJZ0_9BACL|nr:bile acid:sodium symporter [Salinicoccus qingdaonensis]SDK39580.1 Arsenite efflux pump ArsB, ACR3 family [Salinicoccus qingdaonensis]
MLERLSPVLILIMMGVALFIGQYEWMADVLGALVMPLLMALLFLIFLDVPFKDIPASIKNYKFNFVSLAINFIWTPVLAYILGYIFLLDQPVLWLGLVMLLVTPCTDWYIIFTNLAKGNTALSTTILPINFILQIILLPVYIYLFFGVFEWVSFSVVFSMIMTLIIPLALAVVIKLVFPGEYLQRMSSVSPVVLNLAVLSIFASERDTLFNNLNLLQTILMPILLFFIINFIIANVAAKIFKFNYRNTVSLVMTTMARNSPLALAIAVVVFDDMPIITLALIIGLLIEIPVLAVTSRLMQMKM